MIQGMYCIMLVAQLQSLDELQGMYYSMLVAQLQSFFYDTGHVLHHVSCAVAEFR
jgi:hypothetical protein